jgi:hypothetical protein
MADLGPLETKATSIKRMELPNVWSPAVSPVAFVVRASLVKGRSTILIQPPGSARAVIKPRRSIQIPIHHLGI